jgi:CubicO group peptidase (beta-lactamase class C family)/D-alanyl-D-alanine dipeptidase
MIAGCSGPCVISAEAESVANGYEEIERRLNEFVAHELKDKDIPAVSVALVDGDRTVLAKGYGYTDARRQTNATADTIYRVGSISKLFTDLAVMQLVAAGKLDLDADIRTYLPDFTPHHPFNTPITLRQLMSHQSGLVRESPAGHYFDDTSPSLADTVKSLNSTALVYQPGTRTKYSNAGVSVAGLVVEKLTGKRFDEHVREVLFEPLRMPTSGFVSSPQIKRTLATAWMRSHHAPRFVAPDFALGTLPAGNLYSSMNELSHFLSAILNGGQFDGKSVIDQDLLRSMFEPIRAPNDRAPLYGIGFGLGNIDGHRIIQHGGAVYGYSTQLVGLPDQRIGVVTSAALDGANGFTRRLSEYAVRLLLAQKAGQPLPNIESTRPLAPELRDRLLGTYASGHKRMQILMQADEVYLYDELSLKRLRATGDGLAIDDLTGFGPKIRVASDNELVMDERAWTRIDEPFPPACPERFKPLIGEYGWEHNPLYIFEDRGQLWALIEWFYFYPLAEISSTVFAFPDEGLYHGEQLIFATDGKTPATYVTAASVRFDRRHADLDAGKTFRIQTRVPMDELYQLARDSTPPIETRPRRRPDLVELTSLDPTIRTDIRYATTNNFMSNAFYRQPRAFMQRAAAEALVRAHQFLKKQGYGLLIHDAYRPWYVTKMFWEGTPPDLRGFVADPQQGSRHNRGCAIDLTLYDQTTGMAVLMVAGYDEMSPRSYPFYPGGTAQQRWLRKLLRDAMYREGFTVYPVEWWHFDYKDWEQYPIGNATFEEIEESESADARGQ